MYSLFQAVNHIHAHRIVHRNISIDKIMITANDTVRLMGLTPAKSMGNNQYLTGIVGSPYYIAPEVIEGGYCEKADIWSLGVLLYTLVSGYLPF